MTKLGACSLSEEHFANCHRPKWAAKTLFVVLALMTTIACAAADRTKPTTPTNVHVTGTTSTTISLAWGAASDNSGVFIYVVKELNSGQTRNVAQTQTAYTWAGLQSSTAYRFLVDAVDGSGNSSANSNTAVANTTSAPPPAAPTNLHATAIGPYSIALSWNAIGGAASYNVSINSVIYSVGAQTSYVATWLTPATAYTFSVRAVSGSAFSAWSSPLVRSTIADTTTPTVPDVSGVALSPGTVRLTWTASTDDGPSVGYNVYANGQPAHGTLPDSSQSRTVTIYNLHAATTYEFTVKAYDAARNFSAPSKALVLTTLTGTDTTPPAAPSNLRRQGADNRISSASLWWDTQPDNVAVMAFEIYMDDAMVGETLYDPQYEMLDPFFTVYQIPPGTTHSFTVRARDEAGNVSPPSVPLVVTMQSSTDSVPPGAPTGLWGDTSPGCNFIDLLWAPPIDNVDTAAQLDYAIYEDGTFRGMWRNEVFEGDFGLHRYFIKALDRAGNASAPSNEIWLDSGLSC